MVGTGKSRSFDETRRAIESSAAQIVTVAVRRTNIGQEKNAPSLLEVISPKKYTILPNTAGCYDAAAAVRVLRLARELLDGENLVKLEVLGDKHTLFPDVVQTLAASARIGCRWIFGHGIIPAMTRWSPKSWKILVCAAVMPLASLIGSGMGIVNPHNLQLIMDNANIPIIVDAGVGAPSDATRAMEMGCDGVLTNTAIAHAANPVLMAAAMRRAVIAGREGFRAGIMPRRYAASPSSPLSGIIGK